MMYILEFIKSFEWNQENSCDASDKLSFDEKCNIRKNYRLKEQVLQSSLLNLNVS